MRVAAAIAVFVATSMGAVALAQAPNDQISTLVSAPMPNVVGSAADDARTRVTAAGIYADYDFAYSPKAPAAGAAPPPGTVLEQDPAPGDDIESGIGDLAPVQLTVFAPAPPKGCIASSLAKRATKGSDFDVADDVLGRGGFGLAVDWKLKVGTPGRPTVAGLKLDGCGGSIDASVPLDPASQDLFLLVQPRKRRVTFGQDWALTMGQPNFFKISVVDRAAHVITNADVDLDGSDVKTLDVEGHTGDEGTAGVKITPKAAGKFDLVAQVTAGNGVTLWGAARIAVKDRSGAGSVRMFTGDVFTREAGKLVFDRSASKAPDTAGLAAACTAWKVNTGLSACPANPRLKLGVLQVNSQTPLAGSDIGNAIARSTVGLQTAPGQSTLTRVPGLEIGGIAAQGTGMSIAPPFQKAIFVAFGPSAVGARAADEAQTPTGTGPSAIEAPHAMEGKVTFKKLKKAKKSKKKEKKSTGQCPAAGCGEDQAKAEAEVPDPIAVTPPPLPFEPGQAPCGVGTSLVSPERPDFLGLFGKVCA